MKEFITQYAGEFITGLMGILSGWLFERKRKKAEDQKTQADALESMQSAYDRYLEDDKKRYQELKIQVDELKNKLVEVEEYWKKRYASLKAEFNRYKREHKK